jgi:hypothetical protein
MTVVADSSTSTHIWLVVASVVFYALTVIGLWKMFTKASVPGWFAIIPILNTYILIKIARFHGATILLLLIPIVNLVFQIVLAIRDARSYGHGPAYGVFLLWLLAPIGYIITGWGASRYEGPDLAAS